MQSNNLEQKMKKLKKNLNKLTTSLFILIAIHHCLSILYFYPVADRTKKQALTHHKYFLRIQVSQFYL